MTTRSTVTIKDVEKIWEKIGARDGFLALPVSHPLSFQLGKNHLGNRCFAVVNLSRGIKVESSRAISVSCERVSSREWTLLFVLEDKSLSEIFVKFCWDLIECSRKVVDPEVAILVQYKKWRLMFAKWSGDGMSDQAQKGLLGELLYLRELIDVMGAESALMAWQGPEGCDQDFEFETGWAEVKTVKLSATEVSISSLQQLERADDGKLVVYFADKDGSKSETSKSVKDAVTDIVHQIDNPVYRDLFECKLARTGYFGCNSEFCKYRVVKRLMYSVVKGFPRVTPESVPAEIATAQYAISLPAIQRFLIEE